MSYTRRYFEPKDHACAPFIGRHVPLPELYDEHSPRVIACLENPLTTMEAAVAFIECMKWGWLGGMDDKLEPQHWGVAWARCCEAMFWRLQDLWSEEPVWKVRLEDVVKGYSALVKNPDVSCSELSVFYEQGRINLKRDLTVWAEMGQATPSGAAITTRSEVVPFPLPERKEHDTDRSYGEDYVYAFWKPLDIGMVINALGAWDASRFGQNKFRVYPVSKWDGNVIEAMRATFGEGCAAGLKAFVLKDHLPDATPQGPAKPRF